MAYDGNRLTICLTFLKKFIMETTVLSSKGQLVIPKRVRELARAAAGDAFVVRYQDGEIHLRPVARVTGTHIDEVAGCLASASRKPTLEAALEASIKARLKAEDLATMRAVVKTRVLKPKAA